MDYIFMLADFVTLFCINELGYPAVNKNFILLGSDGGSSYGSLSENRQVII